MKRFLTSAIVLLAAVAVLEAKTVRKSDFNGAVHILDSLLSERTGVVTNPTLKKVTARNGVLDFHFDEKISFRPIRPADYVWMRKVLGENLPAEYGNYAVGRILLDGSPISSLAVTEPGSNGRSGVGIKVRNVRSTPLVDRGIKAARGLSGRHIALWQSHGRYYDNSAGKWKWQRPLLFQTVEDIFTQSFVVPFLVPMLENAGATVMLPRERDWRSEEIIIDNDQCESSSPRLHGTVIASGKWTKAGSGFADTTAVYHDGQNPFEMGTFLWRECRTGGRENKVIWAAEVPSRGEYAVYVTYRSLPESSERAHYTVHTAGCDVDVYVDQSKGGGSWIYLGSYEFDKGSHPLVSLSDISSKGGVVVADAVRIGGGYGNLARGPEGADTLLSGMPRNVEGARYFMQWSGIPEEVWSQNEGRHDYRDDLMSRGKWVEHLSGGSWANPKGKGLGIPIDLSLAFHSDAGVTPDDSIIGTLSIYTLKCEGKTTFSNGYSRATSRELADWVQTQVTDDIKALWNRNWQRRELRNRSYSESRTTGVPAVLLELLSHQNFEDMKYGMDPLFKFTVARSCYKAILKYLSMRYNCPYVVQPLPVRNFSARLDTRTPKDGGYGVELSWKESVDSLEPTARATAFRVFTRVDDGGWDKGVKVTPKANNGVFSVRLSVGKGHIHSYKIVALNDGGCSFPSEILAVGMPQEHKGKLLIVNNFNRISGPVWFDSPTYAGFDSEVDGGVPYIRDWSYAGRQTEFDRTKPYIDDDQRGFGANGDEYAGRSRAGNSFDYPYIHGLSAFRAGYAFDSASAASFCESVADGNLYPADGRQYFAIDLICGKECRVRTATASGTRGGVLPVGLQKALLPYAENGCNIIISGSYIAHDVFGAVYPSEAVKGSIQTAEFAREVLGYELHRAFGTKNGIVNGVDGLSGIRGASFPTKPCESIYCVESPDALHPVSRLASGRKCHSTVSMTYGDTGWPAAVRTAFDTYSVAAFGFPLETVGSAEARDTIIRETLEYFRKQPATE